jgi:RNA polymerase sigma-70 factor (ECF subfamily)
VSFTDLEDAPALRLESRAENPEQSLLRGEHRDRLEAGLEVLTSRERLALLLRDVEDMPAEEVAAQMRCSKATVRSHIANARVKLRRFLERERRRT